MKKNDKVETIYISLGGGCDVATILRRYKYRLVSLPFDWLWNLNEGLESVTKIIANDFSDINKSESFTYRNHYKFPNNKTLTFENYPTIAHIHENFLEEIDKFNLRIERLKKLLRGDNPIVFVYYRQYNEGLEKTNDEIIFQRLNQLFSESEDFVKMVEKNFLLTISN